MFWIVFIIVPIVFLTLFEKKKPDFAPLVIVFCPIVNVIFFFQEFMYYEARTLLLFFTAIQMAVVAVPAFLIRWKNQKK